jgi:hypothetical protein
MVAPAEKPESTESKLTGTSNGEAGPPTPSNDNWLMNFNLFGFAKSLSLGAASLTVAGWLIHSYGAPAAASVWSEMIHPRINNFIVDEVEQSSRINDFMVSEINDYLSGNIKTSKEKPNEVGAKLKALTDVSDRIEVISNSLFGSVDSVYPISVEYDLEQIKDKEKNTVRIEPVEPFAGPVRLFVYADPTQHCVWAFVRAKGKLQRGSRKENLYFSVKLNAAILGSADGVPFFAEEIGKYVKSSQGTGGGGRDEEQDLLSATISQNIQRVEVVPQFPAFDPIQIVGPSGDVPDRQQVAVRLDGYVLVTRRRLGNQLADCRSNPLAASANNVSK